MRGVTSPGFLHTVTPPFQPALPMRGVTFVLVHLRHHVLISTRTPHAGSDLDRVERDILVMQISTRTPHAGSDCNIMCKFTASINI